MQVRRRRGAGRALSALPPLALLSASACADIAGVEPWVDQAAASSADQGHGGGGQGGAGASSAAGGIGGTGGTAGAAPIGYVGEVLVDRPLAYWRLGETPGALEAIDTAADHDGNYQGGVQLGAVGAIGQDTAAEFDGESGQVLIGDVFDFPDREAFTIEAWVNPSGLNLTYRHIVDNRFDNENNKQGYVLFVKDTELAFERYLNDDTEAAKLVNTPPIPTGKFSHVVGAYDGSVMRLYVDGVQVAMVSSGMNLLEGHAAGEELVIGANGVGSNEFLGVIDEVAIYAGALSPQRVQAHFQAR